MWKRIAELFRLSKQEAKEKLKKKPDHHDCNFGIDHFNKTKRDKEFVQEINTKRKGKPGGGGSPMPPAPPLPPASNPPGILLLDFNGGVCSGTNWNVYGDINYAWSGLTDEEITEVIRVMQWDYQDFNVIVTTDENMYNAAPANRRQRAIFTETHDWYGSSAGGTSFRNTFAQNSDNPCWIFTSLLGYIVRKISAAGSHELGHTLGLYHQSTWNSACQKIAEYNAGDGIASPIMGYPYALPCVWWYGPNSQGCADMQDDRSIIKTVTQ